MNIYIEHEKKFYSGFWKWEDMKDYPIAPKIALDTPTDNPQFAPGDRVYFEDLEEWTEVVAGHICEECVFSGIDRFLCEKTSDIDCNVIYFRKLTETTEPEKSPEPIKPAAILDNERNRIAHDYMKAILSEGCIPTNDNAIRGDIDVVFAIADAFIARAKQEDK